VVWYISSLIGQNLKFHFLGDEYRLFQEGSIEPTAYNIIVQKACAASLHDFVLPVISAVLCRLDISYSIGFRLESFQETYFCSSAGVELNEVHRAHAQKKSLAIYANLDELEKREKERFDLISMAYILQYLPTPVDYHVRLRERFLASDGWLMLEEPNLLPHDSFETAHLLFAFSIHKLRQMMGKVGY